VTLHREALAELATWSPPPGRQTRLRDRYVDHLHAHADGTERSCFPDHLTAGTLVLSAERDRVLLNLHRKAGRWFAFGGHCEPGDGSLLATAHREATEESGIAGLRMDRAPVHLDEHAVDFCDPRGTVHHLDVRFVAVAPAGAEPTVSAESTDVRWWSVDDLPDLEDEMHALIAAARERVGQSTSSASSSPSAPGGGSSWAAADQPDR
jgi:8-oxo-dGTP pyrophosphatase MutT (NUDIX family)